MTVGIALQGLRRFKSTFPDWHQVPWRNSVVETTTIGVEVWHVASGRLVRNAYLAFDSADWQIRLIGTLEKNARRGS